MEQMCIGRIVIAGTQSGSGKTTVATGVIAALSARLRVQPFKCGPDYIDPTYHTHAAGRPSRNLDTWMVPEVRVRELYERACHGSDAAVIEGVMGLFDGRTGGRDAGSTAQVAKLLHAPVVLVVDAARVARSAAALVHGFNTFDPELNLEGVILNRVAGERHYKAVAEPIESEAGVPVLGYLPRSAELELPERYLGLVPTAEGAVAGEYFERLRRVCEQTIDLARLETIAMGAPRLPSWQPTDARAGPHPNPLPPGEGTEGIHAVRPEVASAGGLLFPERSIAPSVRVAVGRDAAFSFYYEDNLDLLRAWGAELVEFSPLMDDTLPERTSAVYIGGGFPELYAAELATNRGMLESLREAAARGMPIYAECGGLMYAGEELIDRDGHSHQMLGLVPARSEMRDGRLSLGYRELRAAGDSCVLGAGATVRAHEFHYSRLQVEPDQAHAAYSVAPDGRFEGFRRGSVLASYMHLHFGSSRGIAPRFVQFARAWQANAKTL
jgi:cobyrinic acid a,c-diamide synthase